MNMAAAAAVMALAYLGASCTAPKDPMPTEPTGEAMFDDLTYVGNDSYYAEHPLAGESEFYNPILPGFFSDPAICSNGKGDYYLVTSTFTYFPGVPIFHSRDLVNWEQVGWAAPFLPFERYDRPAHKCGTWAPSIRYMHGLFYVYVCLPDEGLMAFTAEKPEGPWTPHFVKDVCGWIDPCPLLDDNGDMYLVHGLANSRCGLNNMLFVHRMSADGLQVLDKGRLVYDGQDHGDVTVEGPKMYKRDGWYYIMCPAGGVEIGYQLVLRSRSPYGPYERRVTLSQGSTEVNGPHQGGWVDDGQGHDWFIHFQDRGVYGRIAHLQPVVWKDGWPEMGCAGEPVMCIQSVHGILRILSEHQCAIAVDGGKAAHRL